MFNYKSLHSETVIYTLTEWFKSFDDIYENIIYDSNNMAPKELLDNYHIFVKVVRRDLGPQGIIEKSKGKSLVVYDPRLAG